MPTERDDSRPEILVVEDDEGILEYFETILTPTYAVETATTEAAALETIGDDTAVVLLDRHLTHGSGDDFLTTIRHLGHRCMVAMITAIEPDIDIVDLPFDMYLLKPVTPTELYEAVRNLIVRAEFGESMSELLSTAEKLATLESRFETATLSDLAEYRTLVERRDRLLAANRDRLAELVETGEFDSLISDLLK